MTESGLFKHPLRLPLLIPFLFVFLRVTVTSLPQFSFRSHRVIGVSWPNRFLDVSQRGLAPQESRMTSLQSNRISRTGISGFVTRSSIAATAAIPISLHGW